MSTTVVLTTPPSSIEERYGRIASVGNTMPSLGLAYLASYVKQNGYTPIIIEPGANNFNYNDILTIIRDAKPLCVGISSTTGTIYNAAKLAELVKTAFPGVTVILGGPHITAVPRETMARFGSFDIGVIGEGELTLKELLDALSGTGGLAAIHGIIWRDANGELITNQKRGYIENLDLLPFPAWDLIPGFPAAYRLAAPMSVLHPEASIITSRGCPYECVFCDREVFGRNYRLHSAEYVVEQFKHLKERYNIRHIMVYDDTFMTAKKRLHDICNQLIEIKNDIIWSCTGNVTVTSESLRLMKKAGCWQIGFGIESGSEKVLHYHKKKQSITQIRDAVCHAHAAGLRTRGFFIIGSPTETLADVDKTVSLIHSIPLDDIQVTNFTPFPGSEAYHTCAAHGEFDSRWEMMNVLEPIFIPHGFTKEELISLQNKIHRVFYLKPRVVMSYFLFALQYPRMFINMYKGMVVVVKMYAEAIASKIAR